MADSPWFWVATAIVVLALVALVVGRLSGRGPGGPRVGRYERQRPSRDTFRPEAAPPPPRRRLVVIVNPTKLDSLTTATAQIRWVTTALDWDLQVVETTPDQTGEQQARDAVAGGADVVAAMGGDGTVRAVASGLVGTKTPLGIIPAGTGNLLFRNLGMDISTLESAVRVALTGENQHIDVATVVLDPPASDPTEDFAGALASDLVAGPAESARSAEAEEVIESPEGVVLALPDTSSAEKGAADATQRHVFLVMAGMGFDASVIGDADEDLKAKMGWSAYFVAGVRNLVGERFRATLTPDEGEGRHGWVRTVMVGNCGRLIAGITLMPDAKIDDGLLDAVVVTPKGLPGWVAVTGTILRRRRGSTPRLDRYTSTGFTISADGPQEVQLDGDHIGMATVMRVEVLPRSLILRLPAGAARQSEALSA